MPFLTYGTIEYLWTKVGNECIWESKIEKLLGIDIDNQLSFKPHLLSLCKKAGQKVGALARIVKFLSFEKQKLIFNSFIESQYSHCPLIWMFVGKKINRKINHLQERALRMIYNDYSSSFQDFLLNDKTVTFHQKNIRRVAIEMYKVKNNLTPTFMNTFFYEYIFDSKTRSREHFLQTENNTVKFGENSWRVFGPIV